MSQQVANTILDQMGGKRKIVAMTGADNFLMHSEGRGGVSFKFKGSTKANYVKIILTEADDYVVTFQKGRGTNWKVVKELRGVYADNPKSVFVGFTGLYLDL